MAITNNPVVNKAAKATVESSTSPSNTQTQATAKASCKQRVQQPQCTSPQQVFLVASSFATFLASKLSQKELQTLINIFSLLVANLAAIVRQQELCAGYVIPPEEILEET